MERGHERPRRRGEDRRRDVGLKRDKPPEYPAAEPGNNHAIVGGFVASAVAVWAWSTDRLPSNEKDQLMLLSAACFGYALAMYSHYFIMCVPKPPRSAMPLGLDPLGPISLAFSLWMWPVIRAGDLADTLSQIPEGFTSSPTYRPVQWRADLLRRWEDEKARDPRPGSLFRSTVRYFAKPLAVNHVMRAPEKLLALFQPAILRWIVEFVEENQPMSEGLRILAAVLAMEYVAPRRLSRRLHADPCRAPSARFRALPGIARASGRCQNLAEPDRRSATWPADLTISCEKPAGTSKSGAGAIRRSSSTSTDTCRSSSRSRRS